MTRTLFTADTTFYVDPVNGSDFNDGSSGSKWKTIQYSMGKVAKDYDYQGFTPFTQLTTGTYNETLEFPCDYLSGTNTPTASCPTILGDTANTGNYIIDGGGSIAVFGSNNMPWKLKGVKVQSPHGIAIEMDERGSVFLEGVEFGAADIHCHSILDSVFKFCNSGYKISAGALVHWNANPFSKIIMQPGYTVTLANTPDFSVAFAQVGKNGYIEASSISTSGPATGKRYAVDKTGYLGLGTTVLPGNAAGTNNGGYLG